MFPRLLLSLLVLSTTCSLFGQTPTAAEVLKRSIAYHDPDGLWPSLRASFSFNETRPNGPDRETMAEIDNSNGWFKLERKGIESHGMKMDSCFVLSGEVDCQRAARMRNYYLYLWGLPMKLMDEGTPLEPKVGEELYDGQPCYVLRVPYEADIWYFYISKADYRMLAYSFYKDEKAGKGELITTEGLFEFQGMRIPNNRTWYELPGDRVLGTDILENMESLNR